MVLVGCVPACGQEAAQQNAAVDVAGPAAAAVPGGPPAPESAPSGDRTSKTPSRTVEDSGAFRLTGKSAYNCEAEAPAEWRMDSNPQSNSADLFGPGNGLYAGYGIQAVNTRLAPFASAYPPPLNDPELYSGDPATVTRAYAKAILANLGGATDVSYTAGYDDAIGDFSLRSFASATHTGVVFFHRTGHPGDGVNYTYAVPMYFAVTTRDRWDRQGLLVARVAASIRCRVQLVPHRGPVVEARPAGGSGPADANGDDDGYNPWLGTEYVHDANTGENYLVSPSENWSPDGPQGPGYYKTNGNDHTLLTPGRSD